jgi:hypothetical protein
VESRALPELAGVHWRPRVTARGLARDGGLWTACTVATVLPFIGVAIGLAVLKPILIPISLISLVHAWAIPELYAARGANVLRPRRAGGEATAERRALGLLGDLLDHRGRELQERTGLALERGQLGVWLLGEAGAVLVRPHRVYCYCVRATDGELPAGDKIAHLLLALREDETGFATVANLAFSGAPWRLRRRLPARARGGLDAAVAAARARS